MSLIDSNDNLSIAPLSVLTTVPVVGGAFWRGPLGPLVAGRPPTRKGSLSIDSARPSTKVLHPATTSTAPTKAIAAFTRRPRALLFMTNLIPDRAARQHQRVLILDPVATFDSPNESRDLQPGARACSLRNVNGRAGIRGANSRYADA